MADDEKLAEEKVVLKTSSDTYLVDGELSTQVSHGKESSNAQDWRGHQQESLSEAPDLGPRYEIRELLGQGGMGSVYKVFDKELKATLAAKVIRGELAQDAQAVKRFEHEIKAASELSHVNLVSVYGHGRSGSNVPYLIMDYIDGESLSDILKKQGPLSFERAIEIFLQTCGALEYAHKSKLIHRDLKPSNIMLKKTGSGDDVRVLDFGIAKLVTSEGSDFSRTNLTQTGDVFGSPLYMSPEQCQNNPQDARSDIYSLGCVMYETLTGVQPFAESNPVKIILKHMNYEPPLVSSKCKNDPRKAAFDAIVQKCLEKSPSDRYQNISQLTADLEAIKSGKPASVKVKSRVAKKEPLTLKRKLILATVIAVVAGASLAVLSEGYRLYSVLYPPSISDDFTDATNFDAKSYVYFTRGQYEKAAPLLEFGVATYRERVAADLTRGDTEQALKDETLLAENLQHLGMCHVQIARQADQAGDKERQILSLNRALPPFREALDFWMRFKNLGGTQAHEAFSGYEEVLMKLGRDEELATFYKQRAKMRL